MLARRHARRAGAGGSSPTGAPGAWRDRLGAALAGHRYPAALIAIVALAIIVSAGLGLALGRTGGSGAPAARHLVIDNPYAANGSWYKGNLQVASVRSVGRDLPSAIGGWYASHAYAFLGISDQNTYTWTSEFATPVLTGLPVVDARYPFGDVLALGDDHWQPAASMQDAINWIAASNGLPVLSAPLSSARSIDQASILRLRRLFGLEVYDASLAGSGQADGTTIWDALLSAGNRVYAFAGDDVSSLGDAAIGRAWIDVQAAAPDAGSLMSSLRQGRFYASTGGGFLNIAVSGRTITAQALDGESLRFIGRGGRLLGVSDSATGSYTVSGNEGYVRIEAIAADGGRAWSQPLFLSWR